MHELKRSDEPNARLINAHWRWDGGHIKFWSCTTVSQLLNESGFRIVRFIGAGRLPFLWKSMIVVAQKLEAREQLITGDLPG